MTKPKDELPRLQPYIVSPADTQPSLSAPSLGPFDPAQWHPREVAAAEFQAVEARHGLYLSAGGTLTQFNAVMAAILVSAFASSEGSIKAVITAALLLHVLAAFLLCWAARPIEEGGFQLTPQANYHRTNDTFRNYRRGWRTTLLALIASSAAVLLFLFQSYELGGTLVWLSKVGLLKWSGHGVGAHCICQAVFLFT